MWMLMRAWVSALRLRTLILAFCSITGGALLAYPLGVFDSTIYLLTLLTATLLQMLSNVANDYGDTVHGADHGGRVGPVRMVQSGIISKSAMKRVLGVLVVLSLVSGIALLWISFGDRVWEFLFFLLLGLLSIVAAVAYTVGSNPYGYIGLGDLFVFIFFGPVAVLGTVYLFSSSLLWLYLLPATSFGMLSTAVLNINNIRDIASDRRAHKRSIPVRIGRANAVYYHWSLLGIAFGATAMYMALAYNTPAQLLILACLPLFIINGILVARQPLNKLDAVLRQMVFIVLFYTLTFGVGLLC